MMKKNSKKLMSVTFANRNTLTKTSRSETIVTYLGITEDQLTKIVI